jgi:hypothetical protein
MSGAPVIENLAEAQRSGRNLAAQCIATLCQPDIIDRARQAPDPRVRPLLDLLTAETTYDDWECQHSVQAVHVGRHDERHADAESSRNQRRRAIRSFRLRCTAVMLLTIGKVGLAGKVHQVTESAPVRHRGMSPIGTGP